MQKTFARKSLAVGLALLLFSLAFLTVLLSATHVTHECVKARCILCAAILALRTFAHRLALVGLAVLVALSLLRALFPSLARKEGCISLLTPIMLKTRLNP